MPGNETRSSDAQWIRLAVSRYERPLTHYAAQIIGNVEHAQDIVQETFVRLCSADRSQVEPHLAEWLFTVCRNYALDVRRKEKRLTEMPESVSPSDPLPGPLDMLEEKDTTSQILRAIDRLPENQREVIRLKFQHGLSYQEISNITRLSVSNVGFLIHTGLKTIRQRLGAAPAAAARA